MGDSVIETASSNKHGIHLERGIPNSMSDVPIVRGEPHELQGDKEAISLFWDFFKFGSLDSFTALYVKLGRDSVDLGYRPHGVAIRECYGCWQVA